MKIKENKKTGIRIKEVKEIFRPTQAEFDVIADDHGAFVNGKPDGKRADFTGADLRNINMEGYDLRGVSFRGADMRWVSASDVDFRYSDLSNANLYQACINNSQFDCAKLEDTSFSNAHAIETSFKVIEEGAGVDFSNANLFYAKFCGCTLFDANFIGANLVKAEMTKCKLQDAAFTEAIMDDINLLDSTIWEAIDIPEYIMDEWVPDSDLEIEETLEIDEEDYLDIDLTAIEDEDDLTDDLAV